MLTLNRTAFYTMAGAAALAWTATAQPAMAARRTVTEGTVISMKLDRGLSSNNSQKGDRFSGQVGGTGNYANATAGLPSGTKIEGYVRRADPKQDKQPGVLDLAFDRVVMPDGRSYTIRGSLISLDNKSVTRNSNGRLVAKPGHRTSRLTYVGYGAGAGLLVSALAHKNTLTSTAIGAGLGYLAGALIKEKAQPRDVSLKQGTAIGVRLDSRLSYVR